MIDTEQLQPANIRWLEQADRSKVVPQELYDLQQEPAENTNIANHSRNQELVKKLITQWQAGWQGAKFKSLEVP